MSIIVLSGFSGAGKTTVANRLLDLSDNYVFSVSATTREKREGELEGRDYYFVSEGEFSRAEKKGEFLETTTYNGNRYGTPISEFNKSADSDLILILDCSGALKAKDLFPSAILIFIAAPSFHSLELRMKERGDSKEKIEERLALVNEELDYISKFDYLVVNEMYKPDKAVQAVHSIVQAEKQKASANLNFVEKFLSEPQAKARTPLQEKAVEIAARYEDLPLQSKIDVIAQAFGCKTGEIYTSPCTGKWRGTSDMFIRFDNGTSLFIGNDLTPKAKTVKVKTEYVNYALVHYNPEIVRATKEAALPALLQREAKDNKIAVKKGLKPYKLLNVEFNDGSDEQTSDCMGWYYVTLAVDGKICTHLEAGLNHDIANGKVSDVPTRENYFIAGALREKDVDYVFNNVGFSSASTLYSLPLRNDVRERAEKTLAERSAAAPEAGREWGFYIIIDLKPWAFNPDQQILTEHFATFEKAKARFNELRNQPYNSEAKDLNTYGCPYAHLTLGMESKDGMSAADILHVRAGQNYLVDDFTRIERLRNDPVVLESLSRVAKEIGFDRVQPYVMENGSCKAMPDIPFSSWENTYFPVEPKEKPLTPDDFLTGERIQTPRGKFYVTAMSREQIEAVGYGFHHQSKDGKYLIMGNGTRAYAIPAK